MRLKIFGEIIMNDLDTRLNSLEEKFSFQDDLLNKLNMIVAEHERTIASLIEHIKSIRDEEGRSSSEAKDEVPPHY
jgi:uncharacterized coiled-coil protein SlyX